MPTVPTWLANGMERMFSHLMNPVQVTQTRLISENLKWVQFSGDLSQTKYTAGNVIEFRVEGREFRHYTPSYYDGPSGICEVLFYLHGLGPGSSWAAELAPGDQMKLMGPGGRTAYQESAPFHVFFGDESALGLCLNLAREADRQGTPFQCLLELAAHHSGWPEELGLSAKVVGKSEESPASPALHWLESLPLSTWTDWQEASFYLAGRVRSIQQLRKYLKAKGIASRQLISAPYWTEGKRGL